MSFRDVTHVRTPDGRNMHTLDRIAELEAALRPFAKVSGIAVPRIAMPPDQDRLWSYFESRTETQYEITRAHVDEAARVLGET